MVGRVALRPEPLCKGLSGSGGQFARVRIANRQGDYPPFGLRCAATSRSVSLGPTVQRKALVGDPGGDRNRQRVEYVCF